MEASWTLSTQKNLRREWRPLDFWMGNHGSVAQLSWPTYGCTFFSFCSWFTPVMGRGGVGVLRDSSWEPTVKFCLHCSLADLEQLPLLCWTSVSSCVKWESQMRKLLGPWLLLPNSHRGLDASFIMVSQQTCKTGVFTFYKWGRMWNTKHGIRQGVCSINIDSLLL